METKARQKEHVVVATVLSEAKTLLKSFRITLFSQDPDDSLTQNYGGVYGEKKHDLRERWMLGAAVKR